MQGPESIISITFLPTSAMPGENDPTSPSVGGSAPPNEPPTVVKFVLPNAYRDDKDRYAVANLPKTYQVLISRSCAVGTLTTCTFVGSHR